VKPRARWEPFTHPRHSLIPNLSYVSEAAAYILDCQLRTGLVPYTDVVWLSSKSFHYPFWDRRQFHKKKKSLPAKPGSFQVFLKGFKDANVFLRENPWPDQYWSGFRTNDSHRSKSRTWVDSCRPSNNASPGDDLSDDGEGGSQERVPLGPTNFVWTEGLKQSLREELEKLVILDYIMRNTDRGLDNWMIKVDWETQKVSIASDPTQFNMETVFEDNDDPSERPRPVSHAQMPPSATRASNPYKSPLPMNASRREPTGKGPDMVVGAIDNSLSWPWKHPDAWRSFPFGWLFLPVDLIGRPFSQKTRDHFLPLLTSTTWWSETQLALKRVFQLDEDFQERMFAKQIAVMKGQAWNVVEALKTPDHGPLELTRRPKVCVWDDLIDVPVAVPMRMTTSSELARGDPATRPSIDELDIASSGPSSKHVPIDDLLGFASAPAEMPHPGRFEITTPTEESALSPSGSTILGTAAAPLDGLPEASSQSRADAAGGQARALNLYEPARHQGQGQGQGRGRHQRRYSYATPAARRRSSGAVGQQFYGGDDLEGDLGYSAAEGQMGNQRKVIVERLETIKSNPVFTWC
jgi:phosphatidylinositol 4-kinase type 2